MSKGKYAVYERINLATPEDNPLGPLIPHVGFHVFFHPYYSCSVGPSDDRGFAEYLKELDLGWYRNLEEAKAAIATHRRRHIPVYEEEV